MPLGWTQAMMALTFPSFNGAFLDQYYDEAATAQSHGS